MLCYGTPEEWLALPGASAVLTPVEWGQADQFMQVSRRQQYLAGRIAARRLLAEQSGTLCQDIDICCDASGKPYVSTKRPSDRGWHFSLSHNADTVVCAVAQAAIGIDIESFSRAAAIHQLAPYFCGPAELAALVPLTLPQQQDVCLSLWTIKEAILKCRGSGLLVDPRTIDLSCKVQALSTHSISADYGDYVDIYDGLNKLDKLTIGLINVRQQRMAYAFQLGTDLNQVTAPTLDHLHEVFIANRF